MLNNRSIFFKIKAQKNIIQVLNTKKSIHFSHYKSITIGSNKSTKRLKKNNLNILNQINNKNIIEYNWNGLRYHGHVSKPEPGKEVKVVFVTKEGKAIEIEASEGDNILDVAQAHGLEMEGACGGSCACSTCHVIVDPEYYDKIPEPSDDENDMLDLAFGLTETSRLGCQIILTKELDGIRFALPAMTRNLQQKDFD